jgi:hypothetical protein
MQKMKSSLLTLALSVALVPLSSCGPVTAVDGESINVRSLLIIIFFFNFLQTMPLFKLIIHILGILKTSAFILIASTCCICPTYCIVALNYTFLKALNLLQLPKAISDLTT